MDRNRLVDYLLYTPFRLHFTFDVYYYFWRGPGDNGDLLSNVLMGKQGIMITIVDLYCLVSYHQSLSVYQVNR